jgi:arylsulfatase A-like enzyme
MRSIIHWFLCLFALFPARSLFAQGRAEHVVVVVWDGMRPDFITPQHTPNLYQLATNGVFFKNHHAAYISSTEVNGVALATGTHPGRNGILGNRDYRPEITWLDSQATEGLEAVRRGDLLSGGHYLLTPTLAEILQRAGKPTAIAGTKPVALLHDRNNRRDAGAEAKSVTLFKGQTLPRAHLDALVKVNDDKAFPTNTTHPNTAADAWTTKALTHGLWKNGVPPYTLLWLSEPDASQHEHSPGSDIALSAIESSDKNLGSVLKALDDRKLRDKTDVLVVSDHGFSTITRGPDLVAILKKGKFQAAKKFDDAEPGDVMVVGLGGSAAFYVIDHVESVVRRLVEFLQMSDFAGVIFSRLDIEGTFPLGSVRMAATNVHPDVVVAMRWDDGRNQYGVPGGMISEGGTRNKGSHSSLSRFDMRNTLVAAGPDFRRGFIDELPTGNIDVAPTILHLLGVPQPAGAPMDGRVLHEALVGGKPPAGAPETKTLEAQRDLPLFRWRQYLKFTSFGGALYFDEGNGEATQK